MSFLERLLSGWGTDEPERVPPRGDAERVRAVEAELARMRAHFVADGGDVILVAVEGDTVLVRLRGACRTCRSSDLSIHDALEPRLKDRLPWVRGVSVDPSV